LVDIVSRKTGQNKDIINTFTDRWLIGSCYAQFDYSHAYKPN